MEDATMNIAPDVDPTCSFTVHVFEQRFFFFFFWLVKRCSYPQFSPYSLCVCYSWRKNCLYNFGILFLVSSP